MIFAFLLFPFFSFASITQDEVAVTDKLSFNFKTVCQKMVTHETPLIEVISGTELDCMGKKIKVGDFCEKEMVTDPYYLRGYINQEKKQVICLSGKKVNFKYVCGPRADKELCGEDAKKSCEVVKPKLAFRLDLIESSYDQNEKGLKRLKCHFGSLPLNKY
ncbi:MAG: hypothetical protein AB7I27_12170 [Bacteriovoracaceae bacterium]